MRCWTPKDVAVFIEQIQSTLRQGLKTLNDGLPDNLKVRLRQQGKNLIHLSPLEAQTEPPNTAALKREIGQRWSDVELIDIVKEVDLRVNFTAAFRTTASREALDPALLQRRLLLCLFGIGTNVGLKRVASQQPSVNFEELRYVKRRFVQKEALRAAIGEVVNGIFQIRNPAIWGSATTPARLIPKVRRLRSESDDRMARALWWARCHDLLACRHQFDLHLLTIAPLLVVGSSRHDGRRAAPLHGHGD
jgi:hypothetical protein